MDLVLPHHNGAAFDQNLSKKVRIINRFHLADAHNGTAVLLLEVF